METMTKKYDTQKHRIRPRKNRTIQEHHLPLTNSATELDAAKRAIILLARSIVVCKKQSV